MGMIFLNKKNIKKIFLFVTLIILFIGLVSATDIESDDTTNQINEKTVDENKRVEYISDFAIINYDILFYFLQTNIIEEKKFIF